MIPLGRCVRVLVLEQLREPLGIFWSFVAPTAYLVQSTMADGSSDIPTQMYVSNAAWCLAYVAYIAATNSFGLYLVGRRESGFVRSFLNSRVKLNRFLFVQYLASMIMALGYGLAFLVVTSFILTNLDVSALSILYVKYIAILAFFMVGAMFFAALPLTFQSANSLIAVTTTIVIVAGLASREGESDGGSLAYINPFFVAARFLAKSIPSSIVAPVLASQILFLCLIGIYGFVYMRINPEWSNR